MAPDKTNNPKSTHNEPLPILFELRRRLWILLMIVLVVCVIGVAGYRIIEKVTWLEALYMTICVVSTLGLAIHPQTSLGTAFSILLAIVGISAAFYGVGAIIQIMVSREFQRARLQGKVWRKMEKMSNHMIIVGYGRIGRRIAQMLIEHRIPFVVLERDHDLVEEMEGDGLAVLHGDASHDEILEQAGLDRARGLIVVASSDAENVLVVMTARQLNTNVPIISRCDEETNRPKYERAGATRIIMPHASGATAMMLAATKPYVIDLLGMATGTSPSEYRIRELIVPQASPVAGRTLKDLALSSRYGIMIIGISSPNEEMRFNPPADHGIADGDQLITVARDSDFHKFEKFLSNGAD